MGVHVAAAHAASALQNPAENIILEFPPGTDVDGRAEILRLIREALEAHPDAAARIGLWEPPL